MKIRLRSFIENILPYVVVFVANIYHPIDPDLGWHLKYGEYFFKHGTVLRTNIFSTEMAGYHWANVSWGMDVLTYAFYQFHGFLGLSLASAGIVTFTFLFFAKAYKLDFWQQSVIFPILLYFLAPLNRNSFRGQLVSLMLIGLLIFLLKRYEARPGKVLYLIPLLFLVWVNLHGLFLLGLGIFMLWEGLVLLSVFLKEHKLVPVITHLKYFIPVTLLSWVATFIHPFGIGIYTDVLAHLRSPLLQYVGEYGSVEELSIQWYNFLLLAVMVSMGFIAYGVRKSLREHIADFGVFTILFALSLGVRRYSWAMYYAAIPFLTPMVDFLKPETKRGRFIGGTIILLMTISFALLVKLPFSQFLAMNWTTYCEEATYCSPRAVGALHKYYKEGKTITPYSYGGWLIWKYPALKPAIDGRMHIWRDEDGYSGFLYTYLFEWDKKTVDESKYDVAFVQKEKPIYKRLQLLAKANRWQQVYSDDKSAIFTRK
jgi:hypothetical protein